MQKKTTHIETKTVAIARCGVLISRHKIADKPICCVPPTNNKSDPFINFFKMPIS